jgi:magnesium chelatase family protein
MFYRLKSATITGIEARIIEIEVDLKKGLPQHCIVGLPDPAVKEAKERVNAAIRNSGFEFPLGCLTVNLAPADLKKVGSSFDLAIAVGILIASSQIEIPKEVEPCILLGELSLDGTLRPVRGVLSILERAKEENILYAVLPSQNYEEAHLCSGITVYPVCSLAHAVRVLSGNGKKDQTESCDDFQLISATNSGKEKLKAESTRGNPDFSDVRGQVYAIRAVEIAAAGGHNLLFIGSPGSGKTMIATRIPSILPPMSEKESIETTKIYSIAGLLTAAEGLIRERPFRAPHHTASEISIIGGGKNPIPGEITLAHNGVLFMDEFPEFKSNIIQSLRQPMESGFISVARADARNRFPAHFILVASMNPCPCGYLFDPDRVCRCSPRYINKYFMRISGPVLDRIDIQVQVKPLKPFEIVRDRPSESSEKIKKRVVDALGIQRRRFRKHRSILNAGMDLELIKMYCAVGNGVQQLLYGAIKKYRLSARSYYKVLKVARTVADLDGRDNISEEDILEVLAYREVENILYGDSLQSHELKVN